MASPACAGRGPFAKRADVSPRGSHPSHCVTTPRHGDRGHETLEQHTEIRGALCGVGRPDVGAQPGLVGALNVAGVFRKHRFGPVAEAAQKALPGDIERLLALHRGGDPLLLGAERAGPGEAPTRRQRPLPLGLGVGVGWILGDVGAGDPLAVEDEAVVARALIDELGGRARPQQVGPPRLDDGGGAVAGSAP